MAASTTWAASQQKLYCNRDEMLHLHYLRQQKASLSADCEFISPRLCSRSEWLVRRAAPQHREVALKGCNGLRVATSRKLDARQSSARPCVICV
ncbi:MAG: hypothetical protein ACI85V_003011 [bacterium]|jgi:hypothetical protein